MTMQHVRSPEKNSPEYFHNNNWVTPNGSSDPASMKVQVYFTAQSGVTPQAIAAKKTLKECPHIEVVQMGLADAGLIGDIEQNKSEMLSKVAESPMAANNHIVVSVDGKNGEIAEAASENKMHIIQLGNESDSADNLINHVLERAKPSGMML